MEWWKALTLKYYHPMFNTRYRLLHQFLFEKPGHGNPSLNGYIYPRNNIFLYERHYPVILSNVFTDVRSSSFGISLLPGPVV
jgi:hypothetical protein